MAHHKSALRRIRRNEKARTRNLSKRSVFRTLLRKFRAAKGEEAAKIGGEVVSCMDHLVRQGVYHRNKAARVKSEIQKKTFTGAKAA